MIKIELEKWILRSRVRLWREERVWHRFLNGKPIINTSPIIAHDPPLGEQWRSSHWLLSSLHWTVLIQSRYALLSTEWWWINALVGMPIAFLITSSKAWILLDLHHCSSWCSFIVVQRSDGVVHNRLVTWGCIIVSNQIDRFFWTTTRAKRLNKNTIVGSYRETIPRFVKIDLVSHEVIFSFERVTLSNGIDGSEGQEW